MRVLVTCGPAIAPIDAVRRITNFSTGALGVTISNAFAAAGCEVVCFKGEAATTPLVPADGVIVRPFSTNDDLLSQLREETRADAIFHAAALCDYEVASVRDEAGGLRSERKIPSRAGGLTLELRPAVKVLPFLRGFFPDALIAGWKYELNGGRAEAVAAGARQLREARTDFCVVNGAAYGEGFGVLAGDGTLRHCAGGGELCASLLSLAERS